MTCLRTLHEKKTIFNNLVQKTVIAQRQSKRVRRETVTEPLPILNSTFVEESETADCRRRSKRVRKEPFITFVGEPEKVDCRRQAKKTDPVFIAMANFAHVLTSETPPVVQCISYASTETVPLVETFEVETIPNHHELCERATMRVVQYDFHKAEETKKVNIVRTKN